MPGWVKELLTDGSFWTAFVAIVLSQLPPIKLLLKRAKVDVELYSKILVFHKVGNSNVQIPFNLAQYRW